MIPLPASKVLIVEGVEDDPRMRARVERMRPGFPTDAVRTVGDAELAAVVQAELTELPRHGMNAQIEPVVIFNRLRFDDGAAERQRRIDAYPALNQYKLNGYGGFDWRDSGSPKYRERTGLVCQPAYQLHLLVGCHFRCAYCNLGRFVNIITNTEEYVERLDEELKRCPSQTLFQYDNYTDAVCFEPEYGTAKLLIDYFAHRPGQALELYVGKSDHVDFLLDYEHRGHTVCCWSLGARTQSTAFEHRSAPMAARIDAMRTCQEAGYPVRVRLSPIIPVRHWRDENREMLEFLFSQVQPDLMTIESIRFLSLEDMERSFDLSLLDDEFLVAMEGMRDNPRPHSGCDVPDTYRRMLYEFIIAEIERLDPAVPIAFCRERRVVWDQFADAFARHGQEPDHYVCNCGPRSAPATAAVE